MVPSVSVRVSDNPNWGLASGLLLTWSVVSVIVSVLLPAAVIVSGLDCITDW